MSYFDSFFEKKQPTKIGLKLVKRAAEGALNILLKYESVKSVIEVGPGRGLFGKACIERDIQYTGIECNPGGCDILKAEGLDMIQALVPPFPEIKEPVDAFIALHVIEHMNTFNDAVDFVCGARDLLRENGLILLVAPDVRYAKQWFWCCNYSHNYVTSTPRLAELLRENGFEVLKATVRTQCFLFPWSHVIWMLTWLVPYSLLDFFIPSGKKNKWLEAKISLTPSAFVLARKKSV